MGRSLCITVRFLQPFSHGRGEVGEPEWPPSPLRMFQALVQSSAARWNERRRLDFAVPALTWLAAQGAPSMVAAEGVASQGSYRLYVPDNVGDKVARAWSGGREGIIARAEKDVRPTQLLGDAVHYLYTLSPEGCPHLEVLEKAARAITHLGWGVDMVAGDARVISQEEADNLPGHRWRRVEMGGLAFRVPMAGTLEDLIRKHDAFLGRLSAEGFRPVPPLSCFEVVRYHSPTAGLSHAPTVPLAAFEIHRTLDDQERNPGGSRFRPFHHVRRVATVSGMLRHAVAEVARNLGQSEEWVNAHVLGHGDGQLTANERLLFLPMPSIQPVTGVGSIRRVLVVGWPGCAELVDLRRRLNGAELIDEKTGVPVAVLSQLATGDGQVQAFIRSSHTWSTVTPLILPGHDDPDGLRRKYRDRVEGGGVSAHEQKHLLERLDSRIRALIWKAFQQAGWTPDVLEGAELEYREVGWRRGVDLSRHYDLPPLKFPRYHVRVRFARPVRGPLAVGAGRFRGMGVFAAEGT